MSCREMRGRSNVAKTPEMQGFFVTQNFLQQQVDSEEGCLSRKMQKTV